MKRWLALALSAITLLLMLCVLPISAEENQNNDWSVYVMEETKNGVPVFKDPPEYAYEKRGLRVTPTKDMTSYTIQLDTPCSLDEGFFMDLEVENLSLENVLMIHLWDQSGVLIGNYNCGSGWYTMISINRDGNDYMMSLAVREISDSSQGGTTILGSMKVNAEALRKVGYYSLSMENGILRLNGSTVPGMDEALALLREMNPDGKVYVGVSIKSFEENVPVSAITLTRFGKNEATASIPGTNIVPGTDPAETTAPESTPSETTSPETDTRDTTEETVSPETEPVTEPEESETGEAVTAGPVTEIESETASPLEQLKDVYSIAAARCHSTIGLDGLAYVAAIALGGLLLRKKKD